MFIMGDRTLIFAALTVDNFAFLLNVAGLTKT